MPPALVYAPSVLRIHDSDVELDDELNLNEATTTTTTTTTTTRSISSFVPKEKSLAHHLGVFDLFDPIISMSDASASTAAAATAAASVLVQQSIEMGEYNPIVVGHRGALYAALENTREAFDKCVDMGCPAVELDVFLLKCGTLIVFHGGGTDENPGDLQEYCNRPGGILDLTYQEALELEFNTHYAEFGCPKDSIRRGRIPTLEEVLLDAKKSGLFVKIELKGPGTVEPSLEIVERLGMTNQCSYASFDLSRLAQLRQLRPDSKTYPTGALFDEVPEDYLQRAKQCGATEIHLKYSTCTKQRVEEIHEAGFGSMLWMRGPIGMKYDTSQRFLDVGNEDESMYLVLMMTGVQQLCVNRPDIIVNLCRNFKNPQQ